MSSRLRHSFVLTTTVLALVLGVSGAAAAPTGHAAKPPDTRVAGIDVDATTIPELQKLMNFAPVDFRPADAVLGREFC